MFGNCSKKKKKKKFAIIPTHPLRRQHWRRHLPHTLASSLSLSLSLSKPGPDISKPKTRNENICKYVKNAEKCCLPTAAAAAATATAQKLRQIELPKCVGQVCVSREVGICVCVSVYLCVWALSHGHNHNASRLGEREPLPIWQVIALCNYCHIKFCTHS